MQSMEQHILVKWNVLLGIAIVHSGPPMAYFNGIKQLE